MSVYEAMPAEFEKGTHALAVLVVCSSSQGRVGQSMPFFLAAWWPLGTMGHLPVLLSITIAKLFLGFTDEEAP